MVLRFNLFWKEIVLFALTLMIGIFSAYYNSATMAVSIIEPSSFTLRVIVIFVVFFAILLTVLLKFKRVGNVSFKFFLTLVVFSGSQIIACAIVASSQDLFAALIITAVFLYFKNVFVHNIAMILGIAGVSSFLGISISPQIGILLLIMLSFYDIFAVYVSKHMVRLAEGMVGSGAIFGFIIPFDLRDIFYHKEQAREKMGEKFMILGSGDIGLPVIMVSSVAVISLSQALITSTFVLVGVFITHILFVNQSGRRPMAALPPIATLTIIGYLISVLTR